MTTISPIRYEVEIQEPLSTPVPMPPSILSSEALVIWIFRIAMKAPIIAARMAIHTAALARSGFCRDACAAARGTGAGDERARALMASPLRAGVGDLWRRRRLGRILLRFRFDGRDDRHARPQLDRRAAFERYLHGDALHHLGEVAGGIIRRQQRELLAAGWREAVDMAVHDLAREHVDLDVDLLPLLNVGELGLLEVRDDVGA